MAMLQVLRPLPSALSGDLWLGALRQQRATETNPPQTGWPGYFYLQSAWHFRDAASPAMERVHEQRASAHKHTTQNAHRLTEPVPNSTEQ